jgi:hypothetical protein
MVHLDLEHTNDACLRIAFDLADKLNAKLIGIAAATGQSSHYEDETITQMPLRELYSDITKRLAHRWALKDQILACYPQFPEFLRMKQKYDPKEIIQSDWYRHYRAMFA